MPALDRRSCLTFVFVSGDQPSPFVGRLKRRKAACICGRPSLGLSLKGIRHFAPSPFPPKKTQNTFFQSLFSSRMSFHFLITFMISFIIIISISLSFSISISEREQDISSETKRHVRPPAVPRWSQSPWPATHSRHACASDLLSGPNSSRETHPSEVVFAHAHGLELILVAGLRL